MTFVPRYLLIISALFILPALSRADGEKNSYSAGLQLSVSKQTLAGIKTQPLVSAHYQPEFQAIAQVVDLQPLLNLREQYFNAQTEVESASAALALVQQASNRVQELYRHGVSSKRQLQDQQLADSAAHARVTSSQYRLQSINDNLAANWGETLSHWAKDSNNHDFESLINGRQALLLISLPAGLALPKNVKEIAVNATGNRQTPQMAVLIANAPQGSELSQGETYFFKTSRTKLRTGMRLSAWVATLGQLLTGFVIPASALMWHAGLATIYLKTAPEQFQRYTFTHFQPIAEGYFVAEPFPANAEVVVTGGQILLSQEFQGLIPVEDDGDDE